jgi:GIY-YIG catalytic domain/NUMOD3 motif
MKPNLYLYELYFPDGTIYFGITKDVSTRWRYHRKHANGTKSQTRLSIAIRKHGADSVLVKTLAYGSYDYICDCEIRAISTYRSTDTTVGHNTNPGGKAIASEVIEKIRAANKNPSPETLARMSAASSSRSAETIEKMRMSHLGKRPSAQTRQKMSIAATGRRLTEESRRKIIAFHTGRKHTDKQNQKQREWYRQLPDEVKEARAARSRAYRHSVEAKAKMSAAQLSRPQERNERMRRTLTGRKLSPAHKANVIAASAKHRDPLTGQYSKEQKFTLTPKV